MITYRNKNEEFDMTIFIHNNVKYGWMVFCDRTLLTVCPKQNKLYYPGFYSKHTVHYRLMVPLQLNRHDLQGSIDRFNKLMVLS